MSEGQWAKWQRVSAILGFKVWSLTQTSLQPPCRLVWHKLEQHFDVLYQAADKEFDA
jgi:hypothetical protein